MEPEKVIIPPTRRNRTVSFADFRKLEGRVQELEKQLQELKKPRESRKLQEEKDE